MKKRAKKNLGKRRFSLKDFIYLNYKLSLKTLKDTKNYIWFVSILFFLFVLLGFILPLFFQQQILELIRELLKQTEGLDIWNMIRFIFINNLKSSFFAIFCGVLFGIVPVAISVVNGYVLGFVANKTIASEGYLVLWRLFPHGIFELPAVFISLGLGLRIGMMMFQHIKFKSFKNYLYEFARIFIFVVIPLLIIAAIIEGSLISFVK